MFTRFSKSALAAAVLVASVGLAHAEGPCVGASLGSPDGGYVDLGHIDNSTGKVDLHGVCVAGLGRCELAPKLSVLGSVDVAQGRFDTSAGKDSSPALKLGAGLEYGLTQQLAVRAEVEHYHFSDAFDAKPDVGEFAFGVMVGF